jgi:hypothetical protein
MKRIHLGLTITAAQNETLDRLVEAARATGAYPVPTRSTVVRALIDAAARKVPKTSAPEAA